MLHGLCRGGEQHGLEGKNATSRWARPVGPTLIGMRTLSGIRRVIGIRFDAGGAWCL